MARTPMWRRYLRFWGSDVRADVEAELGFHVDALTERLVRDGRDPAEARAEAARRFGDYARAEAACVEIDQGWERQRRWRQLVADLWQDLRIGGRTLAKNPGFTISAVVVLGLGLGAAITMLSVINAVFVRPLPFPEPDRIVSVVRQDSRFRGVNQFHPQRSVAFLRDRGRAFSVLAGIGVSPGVNLVSEHGSTYIRNVEVTAGYFQVFGVVPRLGRPFSRDDEAAPSTVVLSHDIWIDHFGGDPEIVGRDVRLGGRPPHGHRRHATRLLVVRGGGGLDAVPSRSGPRRPELPADWATGAGVDRAAGRSGAPGAGYRSRRGAARSRARRGTAPCAIPS